MNIKQTITNVENKKVRSAWDKGVKEYALELLEELEENYGIDELCNKNLVKRALLNGASNWSEYSWGGCSYIYNGDIAERLCNNTELKITKNGTIRPNKREEWLDVQARALFQAEIMILDNIVFN